MRVKDVAERLGQGTASLGLVLSLGLIAFAFLFLALFAIPVQLTPNVDQPMLREAKRRKEEPQSAKDRQLRL